MDEITFLLPYLGRWDQFTTSRFHFLTEHLVKNGHTVHVIQAPSTDSAEITFSEREIDLPADVNVHDASLRDSIWNAPFANKVFQKGYYGVGVRKQVSRLIETEDIDVLWLYNLPHYPLTTIDSVPIVFDVVDDYIAMLNSELPGPKLGPIESLQRWAFARLLARSDLITVISHELRDEIREMIGNSPPAILVPNGVDMDLFEPQQTPEKSGPRDPPVVGFVGSFEYFIDFDLVLDAASALPNIQFLLVGDGREHEYVQQQCAKRGLNNVELPGLVESEKVPEYIRRMDICLNTFERVPLAHSAVPLKLFEYLSQGRPVISTRINEVKRIDEDFLYYADTQRELVDAIETIVSNYDKAIDRTARAGKLIETEYNWDAIAESFEAAVHDQLISVTSEHL